MTAQKGRLYAVDDVLACKKVRGKFLYRIRWSGYGAADDTWEGEEAFSAGSLSHIRPRLDALEQLWLDSAAEKDKKKGKPKTLTPVLTKKKGAATKPKRAPASSTAKSRTEAKKVVKKQVAKTTKSCPARRKRKSV